MTGHVRNIKYSPHWESHLIEAAQKSDSADQHDRNSENINDLPQNCSTSNVNAMGIL